MAIIPELIRAIVEPIIEMVKIVAILAAVGVFGIAVLIGLVAWAGRDIAKVLSKLNLP